LVGGDIGGIEKKVEKMGIECVWLGEKRDEENDGARQFSLWTHQNSIT